MRKGDGWEVQFQNIQNEFDIGLRLVRKAFKELEALGYAKLVSLGKNETGGWKGKQWQLDVDIEPPVAPIHPRTVRECVGTQISSDSYLSYEEEKKKCPLPSLTRSEDDMSFSIQKIATRLLESSKLNPGAKPTPPAGKSLPSESALNCIFDRKLPRIAPKHIPSDWWIGQFCEEYSPPWDASEIDFYLLEKGRFKTIHDMEKYLSAFFEKMENDRTKPGKKKP